jgi:hypothetical protein
MFMIRRKTGSAEHEELDERFLEESNERRLVRWFYGIEHTLQQKTKPQISQFR